LTADIGIMFQSSQPIVFPYNWY